MNPENFPQQKWLEGWLALASQDNEFRRAVQELEGWILLELGETRHLLRLNEEGLVRIRTPKADDSWNFALRAPLPTWERLLRSDPPPGFQSLTALRATDPSFRWEGDMCLAAQALQGFQRLVEIARESHTQSLRAKVAGAVQAKVEMSRVTRDPSLITGHYVDLQWGNDLPSRVYYEVSGRGFPLVLLHTAGADSRQYHEMLSDTELAKDWRMFAFDLPFHGRSLPPDGWWRTPYGLTAETYARCCATFIRQIVGEKPVVLGCSMGAAMAVYLAARYREHVQAIIALEAPDRSPGRRNRFLTHPQVNQSVHNPSYVYGLMNPLSPEVHRRRAWWYYSQCAFGVYDGDLQFYSDEWDGPAVAGEIDTAECPVFLLTGEYDYSSPPEATRRLAVRIPGADFRVMKDLGHFPMTENPDLFRIHLLPVLQKLKSLMLRRSSPS